MAPQDFVCVIVICSWFGYVAFLLVRGNNRMIVFPGKPKKSREKVLTEENAALRVQNKELLQRVGQQGEYR
jgi:hypothetical protein